MIDVELTRFFHGAHKLFSGINELLIGFILNMNCDVNYNEAASTTSKFMK